MKPGRHEVAIVGAGQLGRRHLEGLLKSTHSLSIHVVDPSGLARQTVKEFLALRDAKERSPTRIYESFDLLPEELDIAIIATTANQRLHVMERLASHCNVTHLILEKFLFNDSSYYPRAERIINQNRIRAWVNTPRRHFDVYRKLRQQSKGRRLLQFIVDGGDWGICCNSIHFVDLIQFMTGNTEICHLDTRFDEGVLSSKRTGYVELTGQLQGEIGGTQFTVRSIRNSNKPVMITLYYEHVTVLISEAAGMLWRIGENVYETETFHLPYQSEMTGTIADQLLSSGVCDLCPFADSVSAHLPLLNAFAQRAGEVSDAYVRCAIT